MTHVTPAQAYHKLVNTADNLSSDEINVGRAHFKQLSDLLIVSGREFRIVEREAHRVYSRFEEIAKARAFPALT